MRMRFGVFVAGVMLLPLSLRADPLYTSYNYVGNYYNTFNAGPHLMENLYSTSNHFYGSFMTVTPLAANLDNVTIEPILYNFGDGLQSYVGSEPSDNPFNPVFRVSTDANGNIINWFLEFGTPGPDRPGYLLRSENIVGQNVFDGGDVFPFFGNNSYSGSVPNDPGTWTESPVPEPGSFILLGTGVLGIAGVIRRRIGWAGGRRAKG